MYKQIVVALDGSEWAEQVLPHVEALGRAFDSSITLIRAIAPLQSYAPPMGTGPQAAPVIGSPVAYPASTYMMEAAPEAVEAERKAAVEYLDRVAGRLGEAGLPVSYTAAEGPAGEAIVSWAEQYRPDLIAMTTHGRGGLERAIMGSVADEVARKAPSPVLLVRVSERG